MKATPLFLPFLLLPAASAMGEDRPCADGVCRNGGFCFVGPGVDDASTFKTEDVSGGLLEYHCDCLNGWTGKDCSVPVQECGVDSAGLKQYCFHGGECLNPDLVAEPNRPICDCSKATDDANNSYNGRHCESAMSILDKCMSGSYCLNDGRCSLDAEMRPLCTCKDGFGGALCEFTTGFAPSSEEPASNEPVQTTDNSENDDDRRKNIAIAMWVMFGLVLLVLLCVFGCRQAARGPSRKIEPTTTTPQEEIEKSDDFVSPVSPAKNRGAPSAEHFPPPVPDMYDICLEEATPHGSDPASMERKLAELL